MLWVFAANWDLRLKYSGSLKNNHGYSVCFKDIHKRWPWRRKGSDVESLRSLSSRALRQGRVMVGSPDNPSKPIA
jgi:hypothetical protein